ncbi:hypothetical protein FHR24_001503 [Wenyingzhuangia heitensis]|uniref:Phage protein D n=1 Tax=Wenyingzhuangia heitensis TaxID=1487859 RepID=A0ABX0U896_9FLAO|nr:hypothetical protein [Wenyingzhuangia heitensis]NIJ45064.1 hypothetical protein [Wenyingzhuangia heitensis]
MRAIILGLFMFIGMVSMTGNSANLPQTKAKVENIKSNVMYAINWYVEFETEGKRTQLAILDELEIIASVDNLTDVATISLPEAVMNTALNFEGKIKRGSKVLIKLGYDSDLKTEFVGYVQEIVNKDSSLQIKCEDALFLFRKGIKSVELKSTSLKEVGKYIVDQIDEGYTVDCDYGITYEKFTIHNATGYDVLKKLQEETKANIYFDTNNKVLHIHPPYVTKTGEVFYSMQKNIENSSLEFKNKVDDKTEIIIESTGKDGKVKKLTAGTTGGNKINIKVGPMSEESMKKIAESALKKEAQSRFEGTFDTWLIPYVSPGYSARIKDEDYLNKLGWYYVVSVTTKISSQGAVRTITPGIKLS